MEKLSVKRQIDTSSGLWLIISGHSSGRGFEVHIINAGKKQTFPKVMQIEEAMRNVQYAIKTLKIPFSHVVIPVLDILAQADTSETCKRMIEEMQESGELNEVLGITKVN